MRRLRYADFAAWLARQPPEAVVGERVNRCRCPLANWLIDRGHEVVGVGWGSYSVDGKLGELPAWAEVFVRLIDLPVEMGVRETPVTRREAEIVLRAARALAMGAGEIERGRMV